jgi:ankyrin repeat protein
LNGNDDDGLNALHYLCRYYSNEKLIEAIKLFIQHGIEVQSNGINAQILFRENPQSIAKNENIEEIIKFLNEAEPTSN